MNFQELLNDPNFQKVVVPLFTTLIPVVVGWILRQIPAVQKQAKRWCLFKIGVELSVFGYIAQFLSDGIETFESDQAVAKIVGLLYALALVVVLGMMVADVVQLFRKPSTQTAAEMDGARWQDNRQTLMDKVRVKWIDGVLNKSLYEQARIAVGLEERPEMVGVEWQTAGEEKQVLPPGTRLLDRFAKLGGGGTLLVLGEPGAGKTTLLLELAQDLLEATDFRELKQPIPIVLNLSAWGTQQFPKDGTLVFTQWLLEELWQQYQVRKEVGNTWLEKEKWTLLLDGLDEVKSQHRNACVEALNQFRQKFGNIEIVLCCRIVDYQKLNTRLEGFQAAVYVQPLTKNQVNEYLQKGGKALIGIATALREDPSLHELTKNPLFLWILTLSYRNNPAQELLSWPEDKRLSILFDGYIKRMFIQRPLPELEQQKMLLQLSKIAQETGIGKEFLIERIQPQDWLITKRSKVLYGLLVGLSFGLIGTLIIAPGFGQVFGLGMGLLIIYIQPPIHEFFVESLDVSIQRFARQEFIQVLKRFLIIGLIVSLSLTLIASMIFGLAVWVFLGGIEKFFISVIMGIACGGFYGIISGLIGGVIAGLKVDIEVSSYPNQAIWSSLKTMLRISGMLIFCSVIIYLLLSILMPLFQDLRLARIFKVVMGVPIFCSIYIGGGLACIQHFAMRLVLYQTKQIPWNFVTFFKQAEDRLFVYRTGGSYVFVHRYLQEHFANLSFDET